MKQECFDVTLYWHDGGSLFLGTLAAMSATEAEGKALQQYIAQGREKMQEIEEGGGYQLEAEPLLADEAVAWLAKSK